MTLTGGGGGASAGAAGRGGRGSTTGGAGTADTRGGGGGVAMTGIGRGVREDSAAAAPAGSNAIGLVTTDVDPARCAAPGTARTAGGLSPTSVAARARPGAGVTMVCGGGVAAPATGITARGASVRMVLRTSFQSSAAFFCLRDGERETARVSARSMCEGSFSPCAVGVGRRCSSSACSTIAPESPSPITTRSERTSIMTSASA